MKHSLKRALSAIIVACIALAGCARSSAPIQLSATLTPESSPQVSVPAQAKGATAVAQSQTPAAVATADVAAPDDAGARGQPDPLRQAVANGSVTAMYTVQRGDTLGSIAAATGSTVADLQRLNEMGRSVDLRVGQTVKIPLSLKDHAPAKKLIPDSELVNGPTAVQFDVEKFMAGRQGYLNRYTEKFDGQVLSGPQIVARVAQQLSVHPRLLLALLEYKGGWVDNPSPAGDRLKNPAAPRSANRQNLSRQLYWAGARLNEGYYGWRLATRLWVKTDDGARAYMGSGINAGTAGLQNYLAAISTRQTWLGTMGDGGFIQTYTRLFGDPWKFDIGQLVPDGLQQPEMALPWGKGETWLITGGPHAAWGIGSPWSALDFTPLGYTGCSSLFPFVTALAPGVVTRSVNGEVAQAVDPSGDERIGWSVFYMHIGTPDRAKVGEKLQTGSQIGHPSCEGGDATGSHLHLARKYNGEWIPASGSIPFNLSGWVANETRDEYDGTITNGDQTRTPCQCKDVNTNGITW